MSVRWKICRNRWRAGCRRGRDRRCSSSGRAPIHRARGRGDSERLRSEEGVADCRGQSSASIRPMVSTPAETATSNFSGYFKLRVAPDRWSTATPSRSGSGIPIINRSISMVARRAAVCAPHVVGSPRCAAPAERPDVVLSDIVVRYTDREQDGDEHRQRRQDLRSRQHRQHPLRSRIRPVHPTASGRRRMAACPSTRERTTSFAMRACPASPVRARLRGSSRTDFPEGATSSPPRSATGRTPPRLRSKPRSFGPQNTNTIQRSYPIILGRGAQLYAAPLPPQGVSIEAEVDGSPIVFPLAPNGFLSWATCEIRARERVKRICTGASSSPAMFSRISRHGKSQGIAPEEDSCCSSGREHPNEPNGWRQRFVGAPQRSFHPAARLAGGAAPGG